MSSLSEEQVSSIRANIQEGYTSYSSAINESSKYNILYTIISARIQIEDISIYSDLKKCLKHHIKSIEELDYGYDLIAMNKINELAIVLPLTQRRELFKYFKRQENSNFSDEMEDVEAIIKELSLEILLEKPFYKINPIEFATIYTTRSKLRIISSIIILILIEYIYLLPARSASWISVSFSLHRYTKNIYYDVLINIPIMLLGIDDDIKVKPITPLGAFSLILAKLFFIVAVANFLFKKLAEKTNL